jgi:hypothetical protein
MVEDSGASASSVANGWRAVGLDRLTPPQPYTFTVRLCPFRGSPLDVSRQPVPRSARAAAW